MNLSDLSLEAISLQVNSKFPKQLAELFQKCLDANGDQVTILQTLEQIAKLTFDTVGITVQYGYMAPELIAGKYLCSIKPPQLSMFNPLQPKMMAKLDALDYANFVPEEVLSGRLDFKEVKAYGFYQQITFQINWTPAMFDGRLDCHELAAVNLHELGHAWTILEFMGQTIVTNTILANTIGKLNPDDSKERIFEVGKAAIQLAGGEVPAELDDMQHVIVAVQIGQERRIQDRVGSKAVGARLVERVADQFAARYMAGASLVTAYSKIERGRNPLLSHSGYDPKWVGIVANLMNIAAFPFNAVRQGGVKFTLGLLKGYSLAVGAPMLKAAANDFLADRVGLADRETPIERTQSIRRELVGFLKDRQLDPELRRQILLDIETIDVELRNVHKYGDVLNKVFTKLTEIGMGRAHAVGQATVQESLANNRLYEVAARLKG